MAVSVAMDKPLLVAGGINAGEIIDQSVLIWRFHTRPRLRK
jgi:hypothetical protein